MSRYCCSLSAYNNRRNGRSVCLRISSGSRFRIASFTCWKTWIDMWLPPAFRSGTSLLAPFAILILPLHVRLGFGGKSNVECAHSTDENRAPVKPEADAELPEAVH